MQGFTEIRSIVFATMHIPDYSIQDLIVAGGRISVTKGETDNGR
jgi:hypothetical protein